MNIGHFTKSSQELIREAVAYQWRAVERSNGSMQLCAPNGKQVISIPDNANLRDTLLKSYRAKIARYGVEPKPVPAPPKKKIEIDLETPREATTKESNLTTIKSPTTEKFKAEIRDITPDLALEWLTDPKYKAPNRSLRRTKVATYVQSMRAGRWHITGEAIKFDTTGRLLDGQHRLNAVVDSGVTIQSLVITGLDPQTQDVMDTGAARDAKDVLGIHDVRHASVTAAACRILVAYEMDRFHPGQETAQATNDEILEYAIKHPHIAEMYGATQADLRAIPMRGGAYLAAMGFMAMVSMDEAYEFTNKLAQGHQLETNSPILTLRQRLNKMQLDRERHSPYTMISAVLRSFQAWRAGEKLLKVVLYRDDRPVQFPPPWTP